MTRATQKYNFDPLLTIDAIIYQRLDIFGEKAQTYGINMELKAFRRSNTRTNV